MKVSYPEISYIHRHQINPESINHFNLIIRRMPSAFITTEHLIDTFPNYNNLFTERIEGELIAYFKFDDEHAKTLFNLLNGKVISVNDKWYPIEVIYKDENGKIYNTNIYKKKDINMYFTIYFVLILIAVLFKYLYNN
jgi:hypothetical protein